MHRWARFAHKLAHLMPLPVLPALFRELATQRESKKISQREFGERAGFSEEQINRWERLRNLPLKPNKPNEPTYEGDPGDPGGDLARVVDAYAKEVDKDPFELWTAALKRAQRERANYEDWLNGGKKGRHPMVPNGPSDQTTQAVDAIRRQQET